MVADEPESDEAAAALRLAAGALLDFGMVAVLPDDAAVLAPFMVLPFDGAGKFCLAFRSLESFA